MLLEQTHQRFAILDLVDWLETELGATWTGFHLGIVVQSLASKPLK